MNYEGTNFKKIYSKDFITTKLNDKEEEKKDLSKKILPGDWNSKDFDYNQPWISNKLTTRGYAVPTGKINNITVLDFDNMDMYHQACDLVTNLHTYYTVETRRGMHVYVLYEECVIGQKFKEIDVQNNGKFVIGPDTLLKRYTGGTYLYKCLGGQLKKMPQVLMDWACKVNENKRQLRNYETSIDYNYEVTDYECRVILDLIAEKHREFFDTYSYWITFTSIMKTLNKQDMWDEYSMRYGSDNYNKYGNMKIWKGIKAKIPINYFCKLLNIPAVKYHKEVPEDELYNEITYYEETTRYVNTKFVNLTYEDFIDNDTLIIESGTGTGKTTCVSKLFKKLKQDEERCTILSIVNLISLARQQKITFAKNGVKLTMYNDKQVSPAKIISSDACICVNSLWKLSECNFKNKIVYIDEIYALCMSLTHNETLKEQRLIIPTLYNIITTCRKLIVSDAHIFNNVMELLNPRIFDAKKTYVHYYNYYKKYHGTPAVRYNDENEFYKAIEKNVLDGESFSFGSDSKSVIEKWYWKLYASASVEIQQRMLLYTSEEDTEIQEDWNNKLIFYSPKITTGVDITCLESSEQFMYITGQSVSSINLLQMSTRTRNMNQLNYYSSARSRESLYESFEDCRNKLTEKYVVNQLGFSLNDIEEYLNDQEKWHYSELMNLNMYIRNSYALDLHDTNILYFYEQELERCGFTLQRSVGKSVRMDKSITIEFKEQSQQIKDDKYDLLIESFAEPDMIVPTSLAPMMERCKLLNLTSVDEVIEYRELIEDPHVLDHFFNYNGLKKSLTFCETKVYHTVNAKMIAGVEKSRWFKIKYVHMLAKLCGIENNLFNIEEIVMPELSKENKKIIDCIKKLYRKRDATEVDEHDVDCLKDLYKFMLDSLTKKLKLYSSVKCRSRGENYNKHTLELNSDMIAKYDNLILIMNPKSNEEYIFE